MHPLIGAWIRHRELLSIKPRFGSSKYFKWLPPYDEVTDLILDFEEYNYARSRC